MNCFFKISKFWPIFFLLFIFSILFKPVWLDGKIPMPLDSLVGLYHPFRDYYSHEFPRGIPFRNFLITDPVLQQYPWKKLAIEEIKSGNLPLWNPYSFGGTPLLSNFQSGSFYPFNIFFFFMKDINAWTLYIVLSPILAAVFMYLYLKNQNLEDSASLMGGIAFSLSGFFSAWLEWGNITHTALWLPLILLSIDKIFSAFVTAQSSGTGYSSNEVRSSRSGSNNKSCVSNSKILRDFNKKIIWSMVFIFSLSSSFFAGHLQTFFYLLVFILSYILFKIAVQKQNRGKLFLLFTLNLLLFALITIVQWLPTLKFILQSNRGFDAVNYHQAGWFLPWQHLLQLFIPDFFGNPATLNYWGIWNYGEFISYIGIIPILLAIAGLVFVKRKLIRFVSIILLLCFFLILPSPVAKLPYILKIPFISTSQPTRLIFIIDFILSMLTAFGWQKIISLRKNTENIGKPLIALLLFFLFIFAGVWLWILFGLKITRDVNMIINLNVSLRNSILPTVLLIIGILTITLYLTNKNRLLLKVLPLFLILIISFDLTRQISKYNSFSNKEYFYPETKVISFLKKDNSAFRIMSTDRKILPPNSGIIYGLFSIEGYDPLYLKNYGQFIASWERNSPDISPFDFNRIITPQNYNSPIADLLNVKYVLSLKEENSLKLKKVYQEGETRIYENTRVLKKAFFVRKIRSSLSPQDSINKLYSGLDLQNEAVVEGVNNGNSYSLGKVNLDFYRENKVQLSTNCQNTGFLVLSEVYSPLWKAYIDGKETKIYITDFLLRGIVVPKGNHKIVFSI